MYVVTLLLFTCYVSICVIITNRKFIKMLFMITQMENLQLYITDTYMLQLFQFL